jgi:hypothetical protein
MKLEVMELTYLKALRSKEKSLASQKAKTMTLTLKSKIE